MKRAKSVDSLAGRRWRPSHALGGAAALYLVFIFFRFRHFLEIAAEYGGDRSFAGVDRHLRSSAKGGRILGSMYHGDMLQRKLEDSRSSERPQLPLSEPSPPLRRRPVKHLEYGRITGEILQRFAATRRNPNWSRSGNFSELERVAAEAWALGQKAWAEASSYGGGDEPNRALSRNQEPCPSAVSVGLREAAPGNSGERLVLLPCGLAVGSSITVVGTPHLAHEEHVPQLRKGVMVSQFMVELRGLKAVDGEDPPKILHLNPRLKGDWSEKPILEHNTCYRMQWGKAMRCDGLLSGDNDETVDGFRKCEKWERSDTVDAKESKTSSWLKRFIGRAKKPEMRGRHVSSFPYRMGFTLEDATGLAIKGDVDIHSVHATSLPNSHPSFSLQQVLEMSDKWKARPIPEEPVQLFIGILSATNHFAERMAIRKTWMQYPAFQLGDVVARFFVALSPRKEVNAAMKKEAEYFKDIVILPFMDRYELVVLKTTAICEYGVQNLTADYIMKCDDDTFVRVDVILKEINGIARNRPLYMGNLNLLHRPLRNGKWAVTYEEWPEEVYPPYANGPGYVISSDIAKYIVSQHANQTLRLFKMEDVSMGMWVEEFNTTTAVQYSHNWKFCQYGCLENYFTAHYQSPRQMLCLWDKLSRGGHNAVASDNTRKCFGCHFQAPLGYS
uniref:Galectin domain-containing protein n=1 Tax=Ananas comosus var. bracteatus TaxID=296719 RepID=A0A6V7PBV5_ANACO|nr:unnamed protein product [Ananas comosus var. bracteatus]